MTGSAELPELSIVLPVYNEGEAVAPVLRALSAAIRTSHELVVVWDFDGDTTRPVVERLAAEIPGLRGLRNDLGRGVLKAMRAGIADARGQYILISMADGSDDPAVVDGMVALARQGADVVSASRYMRGGRQVGGPLLKRTLSRAAGLSLHWLAGVGTHDATNNFKLYARRYLDAVTIESRAGFELALELTVKATLAGRRVAELPTTWRDRTEGKSNFKLRAWLPHYLHWYRLAFAGRLGRRAAWGGVPPEDPAGTFLGRLWLAVRQIGLPAWFVAVDLLWVAKAESLAADARAYQVATLVWVSGGDPWATPGLVFAAGPHVLLLYLPTTLLFLEVSAAFWTLLGLGAAAWLVRRLGAPWWWLAFPPLFHAVWNGNPQTLALALLVSGGALGATVAAGIKYYALVPLLARPRVLAMVIAGLALAMPFLPVERYLADGLGLSGHVASAWNGSAARVPILLPLVLAALLVLRRKGAEWLAVPALWPATQFYYVAMALPAIVGRPLVAAALALPAPLMVPAVVLGLAAIELRERSRGARRSAGPGPAARGS